VIAVSTKPGSVSCGRRNTSAMMAQSAPRGLHAQARGPRPAVDRG
jgi:hypothetical protein